MLEPFQYSYMINAIWVSSLVGALCAFLSAFLMLKGWSLIGDALSHSIVPGVVGAHILALPFSIGAFISAGLAAGAMLFVSQNSKLKNDAVIGLIFAAFFGLGIFINSISPIPVNPQYIINGNILAISPFEQFQLVVIAAVCLAVLILKYKDFMAAFFDEAHATSIGLRPTFLKILFFALLSAATVAAFQTVGAFLVVALVITPGATAYLLTDHFPRLIALSVIIGAACCALGAYISYFINGATGGTIIVLLTMVFLITYLFAPKHGLLAAKRRRKNSNA